MKTKLLALFPLFALSLINTTAHANTCVELYDVSPKSAINVCQKELKKNPNDAELQFYLGYAYDELENYKKPLSGMPSLPIKDMPKPNIILA